MRFFPSQAWQSSSMSLLSNVLSMKFNSPWFVPPPVYTPLPHFLLSPQQRRVRGGNIKGRYSRSLLIVTHTHRVNSHIR